jgi:hypothetical protein
MQRQDGSVRSSNNPVRQNRYLIKDYGLYKGVVRSVIYTDDDRNDSGAGQDPTETVYVVMVIGGDRDGQIFNNARLMRNLGGFDNYSEITLKSTEGISHQDITSIIAAGDPSLNKIEKLGGDSVYIQFLNGDPHMPVIVGMSNHQEAPADSTSTDGPVFVERYNGITTDIDKNGVFTWSKDNGAYVPFLPNIDNPLAPFINQFAPLTGQTDAVVVTLNNTYELSVAFLPGLTITADGLKDSVSIATAVGTAFEISGPTDSLKLSTTGGASLALDTTSGLSVKTATGDALAIGNGAVSLKNTAGANLSFDATGFIKLGNSSGDVLKDVLEALIQALTTEAPAGFGAPLLNVATYVQLLTKIQLITGG